MNKLNWSFENIKNIIESYGHILIDKELNKDRQVKINYICRCGNPTSCVIYNILKGVGCKKCQHNIHRKFRKNYDIIKEKIESLGNYKLITKKEERKKAHDTWSILCVRCNYTFKTRLDKFIREGGCSHRSILKEDVEKLFKDKNCIIKNEYTSTKLPIYYECLNCGYTGSTYLHNWINAESCKGCASIKKRKPDQKISEDMAAYGCRFIARLSKAPEQFNQSYKIQYECKCGKVSYTNFQRICNKRLCDECGQKDRVTKMTGSKNPHWIEDREKVKEELRFRKICRNLVVRCYKLQDKVKDKASHRILGYTSKQLKDHIKNHKNWPIQSKKWNIDHIFPIKAFLDYKITDIKLINCLENLQPLSELENLQKSGSYDIEEFENWLKSKGVVIEN